MIRRYLIMKRFPNIASHKKYFFSERLARAHWVEINLLYRFTPGWFIDRRTATVIDSYPKVRP